MAPFPSPTQKFHSTTYESISPTRPELSAKGRSVVVTGGGTGIGAETARYFAAAGASRIALLGRREQPLLDTKASIEQKYPGTEVFVASADITNQGQIDTAFAKFAGNGKIDVLISNAAVSGPHEGVGDVEIEPFLEGIQTNLKGSIILAKALLRHGAKDAVVVDINSSAAHQTFADKFASYSIAKLAVYRLWDSLAFSHPEMSVYHTQPGIVDTDMNRAADGIKSIGWEDDASLPASFNVWLASPEARFLKNKFLYSNWDVDELKAQADEIAATGKFNIGLFGWPFENASWKPTWKSS